MSERIALGFCNNVDYEIVWDSTTLEDLVDHYKIRADELPSRGPIHSERGLILSILSFMQAAKGGEQFVSNSALIEQFAGRFEKRITLGGTSVRAAIAMRVLGYTSALHLITQNDHVRRLIPADSLYVCSNPRDSYYPHLIVQFDAGATVRAGDIEIRASQANRLIYHCNADRIALKINEDFANLITEAKLFLISGFNAIQDERLLMERLDSLNRIMHSLPADAAVFCEDGAYYNPRFRQLMYRHLNRRIDVYSLNEDELQIHLKRDVDTANIEQTRAALSDLRKAIPARVIVLHTRHWALAHGRDPHRYAKALKAGVTMATTRFRYGDDFSPAKYCEIAERPPSEQNAHFADALNTADNELFCQPVADVEQQDGTTIGLGDAFVGGFLPAMLT